MNGKIITIMLCMGLITIGASSTIGMKIDSEKLAKPLVKIAMLTSNEEDYGVATGGILDEDSYEIDIIGGNLWQRKKLDRNLNSDVIGFFKLVYIKDVDLIINYKITIDDPDNSTEHYGSLKYEKEGFEILEGSEITCESHTVKIMGFNGWLLKFNIKDCGNKEDHLNNFMFIGGYESLEII